jgi:hypothetical protein
MKVNITDVLIVFDEMISPPTDEELGVYWFRRTRADGLILTLTFSIYENYVLILVSNRFDAGIADLDMKNCSEIRVLDEKKKQLEVLHEKFQQRCFISLTEGLVFSYSE